MNEMITHPFQQLTTEKDSLLFCAKSLKVDLIANLILEPEVL